MILILAASLATPSPSPSPAASDVCGGQHTGLLAALDRPSIGFSPCAVKPGEGLAELGYSNAWGPGGSLATYPQGFVRFGAAPNLELDLIAGGRFDSGFGAKYEFWHGGGRALASDFLYTAPTGAAAFTAGGPTETLNVDYSMSISPVLGFATTVGAQSGFAATRNGNSGRFFNVLPSAVLSDQWNPRAQAFVEAYGQSRTRPDGGALFGMDAAVQYLLAPQLEIDVEAGRTVTDVTRSRYAGFGFGVRF